MQVDFDPKKAAANLRKHRVSLDEAAGSLLDPLALVREDASTRARRDLCWWGYRPGGAC
jgi:uncharacterized DUF497 family protein